MVNVSVKFDYVSTLLITLNELIILKEPPKLTKLITFWSSITDNDRIEVQKFILSNGFAKDSKLNNGKLQFPQYANTSDFLQHVNSSKDFEAFLRRFEEQFEPYWTDLVSSLKPQFDAKQTLLESVFDKIMDAIKQIYDLNLPATQLCIIGGLYEGGNSTPDAHYCYLSTRYLESEDEKFLRMFIHEYAGHQFCRHFISIHTQVFGCFDYKVDEGFAKFISNKILELSLGKTIPYAVSFSGSKKIEISYNTFSHSWDKLKKYGDFGGWYAECLNSIKRQIDAL